MLLPAEVPRNAVKDHRVTGFLLPVWEIQAEFQAPDQEREKTEDLSVCPSSSFIFIYFFERQS